MQVVRKTIYLLTEGTYIHCENDTITFEMKNGTKQKLAYHVIDSIIIFYNTTLSSYVMYECSKHQIVISYISAYGRYLGSFIGEISGNVLLRKKQFDMIDDIKSVDLVRNILGAKIHNSIWTLQYFGHHNENREYIKEISDELRDYINDLKDMKNIDDMRLLEAKAASRYFSVFDLLLKSGCDMIFDKRTKRPPLNKINALLSYLYSMMTNVCCSALMSRGLDSECGYLHTLRSGRNSLACDLVEEFRSCVVDRFVITVVNRKEIVSEDFEENVHGIRLTDDGRRKLLQKWDNYLMTTEVSHKLYDKKLSLKLLSYEQAQLLAQYIRGDISEYPPFLML